MKRIFGILLYPVHPVGRILDRINRMLRIELMNQSTKR